MTQNAIPSSDYGRPRARRLVHMAFVYACLVALTLFILLPLGWMITAALKPDNVPVFTFPPEWFPTEYFNFGTFVEALTQPNEPYLRFAANSLLLASINIVGAVLSNSLIAYAFARLEFRGKNVLFAIVLATMLLPAPVLLIPQFLLFFNIGWYGTVDGFPAGYLPLTVPAFTGNPFFIFLLRQFFLTIPKELEEAARLDGCSTFGVFWHIMLPLSKPALTTVALFSFIGHWNDFLGPLIYTQSLEKKTLALGLTAFKGLTGTEYNLLMAASVAVLAPVIVIFFVAQRYFVQGIATQGLKG